jgi:hypothetical protein
MAGSRRVSAARTFSEYVSLSDSTRTLRELPAYQKGRLTPDVRENATLSCFNAWVFFAGGNDKGASEYLLQAVLFVLQAAPLAKGGRKTGFASEL